MEIGDNTRKEMPCAFMFSISAGNLKQELYNREIEYSLKGKLSSEFYYLFYIPTQKHMK